ncbi:MAG TPA: RloB family protein [Spirochaetota bacterium]|nr:RloB family protein [Spirochaetota bacterium]
MGHDKLFQKKKVELSRKVNTRSLRRILIVCEGEKTEPNYFKCFPQNPLVFDDIDIQGTGFNTVSLVRETIRLKAKADRDSKPFIEVWCVFDKDSFTAQDFTEAIRLAGANGIKCAYSIEAFELWYLLHFNYCDSALSRTQYKAKLSEQIGKAYAKNSPEMYSLLEAKQKSAIKNAKRLFESQKALPCHLKNPVTTVFRLVEKLRGE